MLSQKERNFQPQLVTLDTLVPQDNFYRKVEAKLDLSLVRDLVQPHYSSRMGRPSIDPVVFFKLQLIMFFEGIRSERQLMETVNQAFGAADVHPAIADQHRLIVTEPGARSAGLHLVEEGIVDAWDAPRMPTIAGMRRRGYPAMALREFVKRGGVTKKDKLIEMGVLENCVLRNSPRSLRRLPPRSAPYRRRLRVRARSSAPQDRHRRTRDPERAPARSSP